MAPTVRSKFAASLGENGQSRALFRDAVFLLFVVCRVSFVRRRCQSGIELGLRRHGTFIEYLKTVFKNVDFP